MRVFGLEQVGSSGALLVESLQHGKAGALAELVHKYQRRIYRIAMQITRNHEDASDVTQETFLKVYESIYSLRRKAAFETWIYRIAVNKATNVVKRRDRRCESSLSTICEDDAHAGFRWDADLIDVPHLHVERQELQKIVTRAVNSLSLKHRTVVVLYEFEGLTHVEIASVLGCAEGTVRSRLYYARKQLRDRLKTYIEPISVELK